MKQKSHRSLTAMAGVAISVLFATSSLVFASVVGVDGNVKGSVSDTQENTSKVFQEMGITRTASSIEKSGDEQTLKGTKGETEVTVKINKTSNNTSHVEVTASEGALKWNKDYAQNVLTSIVQKS